MKLTNDEKVIIRLANQNTTMSKSVIIELDEIGRPTIEGVGFTGTTCDEHLKPFVDGFRDPKASAPLEVHKPERARSARSTITAKAKAHQR